MLFTPEFESIQADIQYYQEQIKEAEERLDRIKVAQAYSDTACGAIEDCIENIDPFYLPILRGHIESMFNKTSLSTNDEFKEVKDPEAEPVKEDTSRTRAKLLGIPDFTPDTYEDLTPNITYSSSGRAYVGFNNRQEAEEFRDAISEPSLLDEAVIMNGFKYEVKFHCSREYVEEIVASVNAETTEGCGFEKIDGEITYNHTDNIAYLAFSAKGRADNYGSYLTRILDIAAKHTVSNKPSFFDSKYELRLEDITLEDALHLQSFNLKKEWDAKENEEARSLWRDSRKRVYPSACKPSPKLISPEEVNLGDIVYLNSIDNQYKVLSKVELDGVPHIEVICVFNSERPSLVSAVSYLKECYLVDLEEIQIDPQFKEQKEEVLTEDVQIYVPKPKTKQKNKPVEVSVFELGAGDVVHRGIGDSQYEVIGTARKDNLLAAECKLIHSTTRAASIGNTYFFKDGLYLVEDEPVAV
ncbi:MAG: hypothetical protein AAGE84_24780 [Cyanobacteria bacterium P01_G01_bin.39]